MPFFEVCTNKKLSSEQSRQIYNSFKRILNARTGKDERWIMLRIDDEQTLYFTDETSPAAMITLRSLRQPDRDCCNLLASDLCSSMYEITNIDIKSIYVTFIECPDWGWNGKLF